MRRGAPMAKATYLEEVTVGGEDGDGTVVARHGCVREVMTDAEVRVALPYRQSCPRGTT